jgi:hypothetical protein
VAAARTCHLCGRTIDPNEPHGRQARLDLSGVPARDGQTKRMKYDVFCLPSCPNPPLVRPASTTA